MLRRAAPVLLAILAGSVPARADCFDWRAGDVTVRQGVLRGLPPGPVAWRIGTRQLGRHGEAAVELRWRTRAGRERRQMLFQQMQDGVPQLSTRGARILLHVPYCDRDGACRSVALAYGWHRSGGQFSGLDDAARQALPGACAAPGASRGVAPPHV